MIEYSIYDDIAKRTGGDIYIGVVGPVRTGKSTFIKRFMDCIVLPNIEDEFVFDRAKDELPQSASGRTIMTTEPKFVPNEAIDVKVSDLSHMRVRMIDCVGYMVDGASGYTEDGQARMVKTPWYDEEIPFNEAAEIGTKKVICDHSTIGIVVTTDGSVTDIERSEYVNAEKRVISELTQIGKPFVVLLNCADPKSEEALSLRARLEDEYGVCVMAVNCLELTKEDIEGIIESILMRFPICEISVNIPRWIEGLKSEHELKQRVYDAVYDASENIVCVDDIKKMQDALREYDFIRRCDIEGVDLGEGKAIISFEAPEDMFYSVLSSESGISIEGEDELICVIAELAEAKKKYDRLSYAIHSVNESGYGIVSPSIDEMRLEEPEIVRQGSKFGVKLKASAPSIHMIRADIETEVCPIVGSEKQSEDLVNYLMSEFDADPKKIWQSNIFGRSLHELVGEGLRTKLAHMPSEAQKKMQETLTRIINEGSGGLICIIL